LRRLLQRQIRELIFAPGFAHGTNPWHPKTVRRDTCSSN
jgi:hypothetical protein